MGHTLGEEGLRGFRATLTSVDRGGSDLHSCAAKRMPREPNEAGRECEVAPLMGIPTPYGTYDITDEHGCLQMTSPAYYFAKYGDADFDDIEGTISRIRSGSPTDWNTFVSLMGSDFDPDAGSPPSTS